MKETPILLVEDNVINQKVTILMLKKLGHRADVVADGAEALQALANNNYRLILMDCQMPIMDGYEATSVIRNSAETWKRIPIVALTANALKGEREKCLRAGMDDYLAKPVVMEDLIKVLARFLSDAAMGDE